MCRLSWNLRALTYWNPQGLSRPVQGLLYLYLWSSGMLRDLDLLLATARDSRSVPVRDGTDRLAGNVGKHNPRRVTSRRSQGPEHTAAEAWNLSSFTVFLFSAGARDEIWQWHKTAGKVQWIVRIAVVSSCSIELNEVGKFGWFGVNHSNKLARPPECVFNLYTSCYEPSSCNINVFSLSSAIGALFRTLFGSPLLKDFFWGGGGVKSSRYENLVFQGHTVSAVSGEDLNCA